MTVIFRGVFGSIGEIYRQNGILGFFSGLIPRLAGDILSVLLASSLSYVVKKYVIDERDLQDYCVAAISVSHLNFYYVFKYCLSLGWQLPKRKHWPDKRWSLK